MNQRKNETRKYFILLLLFVAWVIGYLDKTSINIAMIPISSELGLTADRTGLILSSFFISYAAMQLIGGYLADKFGYHKVLPAAICVWSVFTASTGMAGSFFTLVLFRILVGGGEGAFPTSSSVAIADHFPQHQRARAKSVVQSGASAGIAVGSIVTAAMTTVFGWRWMFFILAAAGVLVALAVWLVVRPASPEKDGNQGRIAGKVPLRSLIRNPLIWKLMITYFFANIVFWGLQSWLPSYWVKVRGMSLVSMGAYSSLPAIAGFASFLVSGWLLDKWMAGREKYVIGTGALLSAVFIYLMFQAQSIPLAFVYLTFSNVFLNAISITVFILPLKYMAKESIGTATGIINGGGQVGSILSPAIMGYIISTTNQNYDAAFWFLIVSSLVALAAGLTIHTRGAQTHK